jgi:glycosyltransferase involved in cell wall biosynthesis
VHAERLVKVLLSTYSCRPNSVSEPAIGWHAVTHALSRGHEVWAVIEKSGYEKRVVEYLKDNPMPGFHPLFLEVTPGLERFLRSGSTIRGNIYYTLWQRKLLKVAGELHRQVGFDLVHHVTFGRCWSPSGLRDLGLPFIWGPVGAAESSPRAFMREFPLRVRVAERLRDSVRIVSQFAPALKETARAATIGVGTTRESCDALRSYGVRGVEQLPQLGISGEILESLGNMKLPPPGAPFRALCLGRLLHWKGFHLAVRGFAVFARNHPAAELLIVNSGGPFRGELDRVVAESGVQNQIKFFTQLPTHAEAMEKLAQSHVLIHPALREGFGTVCSEAMAAGRPVICLDVAGPAFQVTPETGWRIPATNPEEVVAAIGQHLATLEQDRARLETFSANARVRVREHFSLRALGEAFDSLYARAVALHAEEKAGHYRV